MPDYKLPSVEATINEIIRKSNDNSMRIRALEELLRATENKIASLEQNMLAKVEEARSRAESAENSLKDLNTRLLKVENEILRIAKFMEKVPSRAEFEELSGFVDLINPIRAGFVTEKRVREILKE